MGSPLHFEALADLYAQARPPYPHALWNVIREQRLVTPGHRVLDLGAGTGQATGFFRDAGLAVTAVEPGPRLAARLQAEHPEATVIVSRAEDVDLPPASFEVAVAATSIHWMDLEVVLPAVHRLLVEDGVLLVWRNVFGDPTVTTPFRDRVAAIVRARGPAARPGPDAEDVNATAAELTTGGLFSVEDIATFRWSTELDERQVGLLFRTFSDWSPDEVDQVIEAVGDLGGHIIEHYTSWLIVLRRVRTPTPTSAGDAPPIG